MLDDKGFVVGREYQLKPGQWQQAIFTLRQHGEKP